MADLVAAGPERNITRTRVTAFRGDRVETHDDRLAGEEPMAIRVAGPGQVPIDVAVTMRTPGHERELALGFLITEALVAPSDVAGFEFGDPASIARPENEVTVRLHRPFDASSVAERHFAATAACGICGKASLDALEVACAPLPSGPRIGRSVVIGLPAALRAAQSVFEQTGGLHAAGLFRSDGTLVDLEEDIGRHNALDALVGARALAGDLPLHDRIVLVSGRIGFEIAQKAAVAGAPILCAVSAPSDLAVETARHVGLTLVGFLRGDGFNVYSRPDRIDPGA